MTSGRSSDVYRAADEAAFRKSILALYAAVEAASFPDSPERRFLVESEQEHRS
ncbi:hypothetical protein SBA3_3510010 [Candidatus Sulfopaludibacter sp. SbA3]|nr:hypothetical protein SBA3_3510010 [Candidatus Sulfopaludibacter sp. SbA3]